MVRFYMTRFAILTDTKKFDKTYNKEVRMNTKKASFILLVFVSLNVLTGCQSTNQKSQVQPGQQVTLTGLMEQGTFTTMNIASSKNIILPLSTPLENYQLYCVTFEDVPTGTKGVADNSGRFSLSIKSYTPFGCFVLDPNNKHVADLLFGGLGTSSDTYAGSIILIDNANVGTITVDPNTGVAVVNVSGVNGVAGSNITGTPFDPTGEWSFNCTSSAADPVYTCPQDIPRSLYLHRISAVFSSDGKRHYGMSVWRSYANFEICGKVEGLCNSQGCTNANGPSNIPITLDAPDGPFTFSYDNVWQPALDQFTKNDSGQCGAPVTLTCSQVTNVGSWYPPGSSSPFTDGQCKQLCYADNFYNIRDTIQYCIEDRNYKWNETGMKNVPSSAMTNDYSTQFVDFGDHKPALRHMFGELIYSSSTSASEVSYNHWISYMYVPSEGKSFECDITEIIKLGLSEINSNKMVGTLDLYRTLSGTAPTECTSPDVPNNYVLKDLQPIHVMFSMTRQ